MDDSGSDFSGGLRKALSDDFVEVLQVGIADFGGDDFDREVGVGEEFFRAVGAEATQPDGGSRSGLLFDDASELIVRELAAAR